MKQIGTMAVFLGPDLKVALQLRWAVHLASVRNLDLLIFQRGGSREDRMVDIPLDEPPGKEAAGAAVEVMRAIEGDPMLRAGPRQNGDTYDEGDGEQAHVIHVRLKQIHFTNFQSLRRHLLAELARNKVELLCVAREQSLATSDADLVRERRLFLRYIPCEVVLCLGLKEIDDQARILLVATSDNDGKAAMQLGVDLASSEDAALTAMHVNPDVGTDAKLIGEKRLDRIIRKLPETERQDISRRTVVDDQAFRGIRKVWEEGDHDLIVMGVSRSKVEANIGTRLSKDATTVLVCAASPITNTLKKLVEETSRHYIPQIEREDRISLVDRIQSSSAWNFDFVVLLVLSTVMAAIGLIQNSAAVVIGAMLVAPLMTPMLGLGLALVQGNPMLARMSFRSTLLGLFVSLLGGFAVGICSPSLEEPTREMLARGGPGPLDLMVAFAAGLAAAYASCRSNLIAALPGVAIAAALVPPIATSGLALSLGDFHLAFAALLLFVINMVTIVLASMTSLWLVGFRNIRKTSRWTMAAVSAVIVAVLALGVYLSFQSRDVELAKELPAGLVEAVQESLGEEFELDSLALAYDELGVQLNVKVIGKAPASQELAIRVRTIASDHYNQPVRVRLYTQIGVGTDPVD